jgi:hypothetical protein
MQTPVLASLPTRPDQSADRKAALRGGKQFLQIWVESNHARLHHCIGKLCGATGIGKIISDELFFQRV